MRYLPSRLALGAGVIACAILLGPATGIADGDESPYPAPSPEQGATAQSTGERSIPIGAPIVILQASLAVSYADLDLATRRGVEELERRVQRAAVAACREINGQYPQEFYLPSPGDQRCVQTAIRRAQPQVRRLIAAGGGGTWIALGGSTR